MANTKKALFIGCGCLLALALGICVAGGVWFWTVAQDPEGMKVLISNPTDVNVGDVFELSVQVTNERPGKACKISDIDLAYDYLNGFVVVSQDPIPLSSEDNAPFDNSRSFTYDRSIPAGATAAFVFTLRAETPGIYRGDVDVFEGARFITTMAQTVVNSPESSKIEAVQPADE